MYEDMDKWIEENCTYCGMNINGKCEWGCDPEDCRYALEIAEHELEV